MVLESFDPTAIAAARSAIAEEVLNLKLAAASADDAAIVDPTPVQYGAAVEAVRASHVYVPATGAYISRTGPGGKAAVENAARTELALLTAAHTAEAGRLSRLEGRVALLTKGYEARLSTLGSEVAAATAAAEDGSITLACVSQRAQDEAAALPHRIEAAAEAVRDAAAADASLQATFARLTSERAALTRLLRGAGVEVQ